MTHETPPQPEPTLRVVIQDRLSGTVRDFEAYGGVVLREKTDQTPDSNDLIIRLFQVPPHAELPRTEPDWRAVVHEAMRRYHLPNDSDERVADIAIGAMEGHGFAAPRTEPAMPRPRGEWDIESTEGLDLDRSFRDRRDARTEPEAKS